MIPKYKPWKVRLKEDDQQFGWKKGDTLLVTGTNLYPNKFVVYEKVADGYETICHVYRNQVESILDKYK